jgi:hypothetical protein
MSAHEICRFSHYIFKEGILEGCEIRADNPVAIYSDANRLLGFGNISDDGHRGLCVCALDPANPERLDLETESRAYWLDADIYFRGLKYLPAKIAYIKRLILTTCAIENQDPVSLSDFL